MSLEVGQTAPPFQLPSTSEAERDRLEGLIARGPAALLFFPFAFAPSSTEEMKNFRDRHHEFEAAGAMLAGISVDSPYALRAFARTLELPFPLLSDFNRTTARDYGVLIEDLRGLKGVGQRAVFVVDRSGTVAWRWVARDTLQTPDAGAVLQAVQDLAG
jgi:peroxiredoxin